jgi:hypothetical protein
MGGEFGRRLKTEFLIHYLQYVCFFFFFFLSNLRGTLLLKISPRNSLHIIHKNANYSRSDGKPYLSSGIGLSRKENLP